MPVGGAEQGRDVTLHAEGQMPAQVAQPGDQEEPRTGERRHIAGRDPPPPADTGHIQPAAVGSGGPAQPRRRGGIARIQHPCEGVKKRSNPGRVVGPAVQERAADEPSAQHRGRQVAPPAHPYRWRIRRGVAPASGFVLGPARTLVDSKGSGRIGTPLASSTWCYRAKREGCPISGREKGLTPGIRRPGSGLYLRNHSDQRSSSCGSALSARGGRHGRQEVGRAEEQGNRM